MNNHECDEQLYIVATCLAKCLDLESLMYRGQIPSTRWDITHPIKTQQSWKIRRLQIMKHMYEFRTEYSIAGCENTSWKYTQLQQLSDGLVFWWLWNKRYICKNRILEQKDGLWTPPPPSSLTPPPHSLEGIQPSCSCLNQSFTLCVWCSCSFCSSFNFSIAAKHLSFSFFFLLAEF